MIIDLIKQSNISTHDQEECRQLFTDLIELRNIIYDVWRITEEPLFVTLTPDKKLLYCVYEIKSCGANADGGTSGVSTRDPWPQILANAQKCIRENNAEQSSDNSPYMEFKSRVMEENVTARRVLGFDENQDITKSDLDTKFRQLCRCVHPDKQKERKKEATALFQLLVSANETLAKKL